MATVNIYNYTCYKNLEYLICLRVEELPLMVLYHSILLYGPHHLPIEVVKSNNKVL